MGPVLYGTVPVRYPGNTTEVVLPGSTSTQPTSPYHYFLGYGLAISRIIEGLGGV
jgi:hypothetical protein